MSTVHIEGMGWLGSILAHRLAHHGVAFTWHDTTTPFTAWPASTGMVDPAGDTRTVTNAARWRQWLEQSPDLGSYVAPTRYAFAHKSPPHGGNYPYHDAGWIRIARPQALTVDVPAFVQQMRHRFAAARLDAAPPGPVVVAHGHHNARSHYIWGWSAPVRLDVTALAAIHPRQVGEQFSFYGRVHRFQMAYAYPIATQPGWWRAGSALVNQTNPKRNPTGEHLDRWRTGFGKLFPHIPIVEMAEPVQGWRPATRDTTLTGPYLAANPQRLLLPPLGHSGVRWAPTVIDAAVTWATTGVLHA